MSNNKLRVEILNYNTSTWTDVTTDVVGQIGVSGVGMQAQAGQTSPRGNQVPAIGRCNFSLNNSALSSLGFAGGYNPSISGLIWPGNKVRVRASGQSLGYCLQVYVYGSQDAAFFYQTVNTSASVGNTLTVTWEARSSAGSLYNTDYVRIATSAETPVWTLYTYTGKWATYSLTFNVGVNCTSFTPEWMADSAPGGLTSTVNISTIEYRNFSITKNGGANLLTNPTFSNGTSTGWSFNGFSGPTWTLDDATNSILGSTTRLQTANGSAVVSAVVPDTWIVFSGIIDTIDPAMHQLGGPLTVDITALDLTVQASDRSVNLPPQVNQTADQIMTTLYNQFPLGSFLGAQFDTGLQSFPYAFDGYTYGERGTKILDAMRDTAVSEFGRAWVDRDGTLRFGNRQQLINLAIKPIKLTLIDGDAFVGHAWVQKKMANNEVIITVTPRTIGTSIVQLAQLSAAIPIPPTATGAAGTQVTLSFVDATGKIIGGANVNAPSFTINSAQNGTGTDYTYSTSQVYLQTSQVFASQAIYTFVNNTINTLWLTTLTVSGNTVTTYNPIQRMVSDTTSQARYGKLTFNKSLPFSADTDFANSLGNYYLNQYKDPFLEIDNFTTQHKVRLHGTDILSLELFDAVQIYDLLTGITNPTHVIVAVDYTFDPGATDFLAAAKFTLERADSSQYWVLDDPTYSVLGNSTRLYI